MPGEEENDINEYFRDAAFPPEWQIDRILKALDEAQNGLRIREIEHAVNLRKSHIEKVLKLLVVEPLSPVLRMGSTWFRTLNPYKLDRERVEHLTRQREAEWDEMKTYLESKTCLMQFLAEGGAK